MKGLSKIVFLSIIITALLGAGSQFLILGLKNNLNLKASYVQLHKIDADILIHGPCEALWMINPDMLDKQTKLKSYNLALSHSDFADNYLHLYLYLKHNSVPKYMFLYVTPESMDTKFNTFNSHRFVADLNDAEVKRVVCEMDSNYAYYASKPILGTLYYNHKILFPALQGFKHKLSSKANPYFENGFEPPAKILFDNHQNDMKKQYPNGYSFKWNNTREKYLREIIKLCKSKGVKLYLYESPVLQESLAFQPNRNEMIKHIKELANDYDVTYLVFDTMEISEQKQYFISTLNMNLEGANIFSDSLGKYIRERIVN